MGIPQTVAEIKASLTELWTYVTQNDESGISGVVFESGVVSGDCVYLDSDTNVWKRCIASTPERASFHGVALIVVDTPNYVFVFDLVTSDEFRIYDDDLDELVASFTAGENVYISTLHLGAYTHTVNDSPVGTAIDVNQLLLASKLIYNTDTAAAEIEDSLTQSLIAFEAAFLEDATVYLSLKDRLDALLSSIITNGTTIAANKVELDAAVLTKSEGIIASITFDAAVQNKDLVYKDVDTIYYQALNSGIITNKVAGFADTINNLVITRGIIQTTFTSYDRGAPLYLSTTNAGELTDTPNSIFIGIHLFSGLIAIGIITSDIITGLLQYANIDTVQELRDSNLLALTNSVEVLGYAVRGDGGGGPLRNKVTGAAPGTYVDDGGSVIVPTGGDGSAAWLFSTDTDFEALAFGDPTTEATILNAMAYAYSSGNRIIINKQFTTTVNIPNLHDITIIGNGSILSSGTIFYVRPAGIQENNLYYAKTGLVTNDGLNVARPRRTLDEVGDILFHYADKLLDGQWIINIAAGTWSDGTTRFNNFPISNYPVKFLGDYSGVYPNQVFNTILDGANAATQAMYFVIGNLFLEFEGLHFSNWGTKSTSVVVAGGGIYCWIGSNMSASNCKFSESYAGVFNQGKVNTGIFECIFDDMYYGARCSYHNRFQINGNTLTDVAVGVSADRMSVGHFDDNEYDGSTFQCCYAQQNSRISANNNNYENCNIAHASDKGGMIIDNNCNFNYGAAEAIKLRSLINGNGIDTRYNGQVGVRENMQVRFRQLYTITGDDTEQIFANSIGSNERILTIPAGFMCGYNRSFRIRMNGVLSIGAAYAGRLRCGGVGDLTFTIPAIANPSTAFKMEIEYFAKELGDIYYPLQGAVAAVATQYYTYCMEVEGEPLIYVVDDTAPNLFDDAEIAVSLRLTVPIGSNMATRNIEGWTVG